MKPTTLEEALAWLGEKHFAVTYNNKSGSLLVASRGRFPVFHVTNGDIPAAIVQAVGQVWELVNGEGRD